MVDRIQLTAASYSLDEPRAELSNAGVKPESTLARVGECALPLIGLYAPAGQLIGGALAGRACYLSISELISALHRGEGRLPALGRTALSVTKLVAALLNHPFLQLVARGEEIVTDLREIHFAIQAGRWDEAAHALLKLGHSLLYVATLFSATPELLLVSMLARVALDLIRSGGYLKKGKLPEALTYLFLAAVRMHQAEPLIRQVHRKYSLLWDKRFVVLTRQVADAKSSPLPEGHPLRNMRQAIERGSLRIETENGEVLDLGAHFSEMGGEWVKHGNLTFRVRQIDGEEQTELMFKLNHLFRDRVEPLIEELGALPEEELVEFLGYHGLPVQGVSVRESEMEYYPLAGRMVTREGGMKMGRAVELAVEGLGTLTVGGDADVPTLHNRVIVRMDAKASSQQMHQLLSLAGLGATLRPSTPEQVERLKVGQLFRSWYPSEAVSFERSEEFLSLSLGQLKAEIIRRVPEMESHLNDDLSSMRSVEHLPGFSRYEIPAIAEQAYQLGARGFTSAVYADSDQESFERVASILRSGAMSSQARADVGMIGMGLSPFEDHQTGGGDSVFTQLMVCDPDTGRIDFDRLRYQSGIRLLYSRDLLGQVNYTHAHDNFGYRHGEQEVFEGTYRDPVTREDIDYRVDNPYHSRPSLLELINLYCSDSSEYSGHEAMFKQYLSPATVRGAVVDTEEQRTALVDLLQQRGLVTECDGCQMVNGVPLERFVLVGSSFSEEELSHV